MKLTKKLVCLFLFAFIFFPVACDSTQEPQKVVRIGVLFPLSGSLGESGLVNIQAIAMAVNEINQAGGILSMGGARLELIYGDTRGQSRIANKEAERLINKEGVCALIGTYQSSVAESVTKVAERLDTPILISSGMADIITERGLRYTFRLMAKSEDFGRDMIAFLADFSHLVNHPVKKIALLHENTAYGTSSALAQKKAAYQAGLEVVTEVSYRAADAVNLSPEVAEVLDSKPDAILTSMYVQDSLLIVRAMEERGMDVPLINTGTTMITPQFINVLGPSVEKYFGMTDYSILLPHAAAVNKAFKKHYGREMPGECALAYQSVYVIKDALERAASCDKKKLREAISKTFMPPGPHMILAAPVLAFGPDGQNRYSGSFVVQIQDGETFPVWPPEYTQKGIRWKGTRISFASKKMGLQK